MNRNLGTNLIDGSLQARKGTTTKGGHKRSGSASNSQMLILNLVWILGLGSLFSNRLTGSYNLAVMGSEKGTIHMTGSFANCTTPVQEEGNFQEGFHDGTVTISCRRFHYKASVEKLATAKGSTLMIGVISGSDELRRRAIRETWKQLAPTSVFFVVCGNFADIEEEYEAHQDILWLDKEDSYDDLPYKTQFLIQMVQAHTHEYKFLLKTDDDCFVNITKFNEAPELYTSSHYWGSCKSNMTGVIRPGDTYLPGYHPTFEVTFEEYPYQFFPMYCVGAGFLMSKDFVDCAVYEIPFLRFFKFDDVATGMLAERCHVLPVDAGQNKIHVAKEKPIQNTRMDLWIEHNLESIRYMVGRWNDTWLVESNYH
jgi:hypothetical protein